MGESEKQESSSPASGTLGGLLYAGKAKTVVREQEWEGLVRAIAAGDQHALHELYARSHRMVFTLILRLTGNPETAEELTVDVFHDIWRRASSYDAGGGTVVAWIMNQARSRAIDRLRFEGRKKRTPHAGPPLGESVADDPRATLESDERGRLLREALRRLTAKERQAIEIAYFSELTYAETAVRLKQPVGTIKTRIRSGLGKLREALAGPVKES